MKTKILGIILACTAAASTTFAADDSASKTLPRVQSAEGNEAWHVGALGGLVDPSGMLNPTVGYGLNVGFQPMIPFSVELQGTYFRASRDLAVGKAGMKRVDALLRLNYNFGGEGFISHMYAGGNFGAVFTTPFVENAVGTTASGSTFTRFAVAPAIGFDCPFADHMWSIGADVSYLFVTGPEKNMDSLQAFAALKYWF